MDFAEIAWLIVAAAAAVFVGFLVPVLINLRTTLREAERLLKQMTLEVPVFLREATEAVRTVRVVADDLHRGTAPLSEAIAVVGQTVQQFRQSIRGGANTLKSNMSGLRAGFRTALEILKERTWSRQSKSAAVIPLAGGDRKSAATARLGPRGF